MINLDSLNLLIEKYIDRLKEEMKEFEHGDPEESSTHTEQVSKAGRGDQSAKKYLLSFIKMNLNPLLSPDDKEMLKSIVVTEYQKLINKTYDKFEESSRFISYYQLIDTYLGDEESETIRNLNLSNVKGIDELALAMYQRTYGFGYLEPLIALKINNIENHGTRKILIETNKGIWKEIKDYRFKKDEDIVRVAKRLMSQEDNADITPLNCEMEGMLSTGQRVSIALKPGCMEHMIFIKKFDGANINTIKDLERVGTITPQMRREFEIYAKGRANMAFIGGINTGKTSTFRGYVGLMPDRYKIGMVTSDFETNWTSMYPNKDFAILRATDQFSMEEQFVRMLRMNRDVMGIEEARGGEVEQWIDAATRGSDGSCLTLHTRTEHDLINNIAWMALKNGMPVDIRVLRYRIASAIDLVTRQWYAANGERIVDRVVEIKPIHDNLDIPYELNLIYKRDLKSNKILKVGTISDRLAEKFMYYNVSLEELLEIGWSEDKE